jgi:hypothetical protein
MRTPQHGAMKLYSAVKPAPLATLDEGDILQCVRVDPGEVRDLPQGSLVTVGDALKS